MQHDRSGREIALTETNYSSSSRPASSSSAPAPCCKSFLKSSAVRPAWAITSSRGVPAVCDDWEEGGGQCGTGVEWEGEGVSIMSGLETRLQFSRAAWTMQFSGVNREAPGARRQGHAYATAQRRRRAPFGNTFGTFLLCTAPTGLAASKRQTMAPARMATGARSIASLGARVVQNSTLHASGLPREI